MHFPTPLIALFSLVLAHSTFAAPVGSEETSYFLLPRDDNAYYRLAHHNKGDGDRNDREYRVLPIYYHGAPNDDATWDRREYRPSRPRNRKPVVPKPAQRYPVNVGKPVPSTNQPNTNQGYPDNFEGTGWYNLW
ncbi:hypothetical protein BDV98DRAFT_590791 [Pterulicium gracile]|uniref:Uncharacterized protein n=1 Tax=Pterulicium gracile TaxID=1884261 RepID=A0A5C3QPL8_9AGAR|nr:hypothetical protein BDV98DRAFT_590791 [Pterula gracilis]